MCEISFSALLPFLWNLGVACNNYHHKSQFSIVLSRVLLVGFEFVKQFFLRLIVNHKLKPIISLINILGNEIQKEKFLNTILLDDFQSRLLLFEKSNFILESNGIDTATSQFALYPY